MFKSSNCTDCINLNITNFNTQLYNILNNKNTNIDTWIFNTTTDVLLNNMNDNTGYDNLRRVIDYYCMFSSCQIKNIPLFNKVEVNKNNYDINNSIFKDKCYFRHTYMFAYCDYLTNENNSSINIYAEFPGDYFYAFYKCESLINTNNISININNSNYYLCKGMFSGCTSLKTAPDLPATELNNYCYEYMFSDCNII